jgi:toxin ParE1/3/4|tara:strand:+ start:27 stop:326 length:300 start_codon:yes stop_codon:yes gene_type:complete
MAEYELSLKADQDLTGIYHYSFETFREKQADKYLLDFDRCLKNLANQFDKGREANDIEEGIYRYQHASHIIFYVISSSGIFVTRILHQNMDHKQHFGNE